MARCPDHPRELVAGNGGRACPHCRGLLVTPGELELLAPGTALVLSLETRAGSGAFARARACPDCAAPMAPWRVERLEAWIERCPACETAWLDAQDVRTLSVRAKALARRRAFESFSPEEQKALAQGLAEKAPGDELKANVSLGEAALAAAGVPLMADVEGQKTPWLTWLWAAGLVAAYGLDGFGREASSLAWNPSEPLWPGLFTAPLAHFGDWHLVGNLAFLLAFGNAVEQRLPRWAFLPLLAALGAATTWAQGLASEPDALIGGASGAIAGLMGLSVFLQPRAKLKVFLLPTVAVAVPLWVAIVVRLAVEALEWSLGLPGVAWVAHLSGLGLGLVLGPLLRRRARWPAL